MNIYIKAFFFLLSFSLFHFGYEVTQWSFLTPFCGVNESVFQHMKMAFWGYILLSIIEYFRIQKKIKQKIVNFFYSRTLSTIILPWITIVLWYLLPALYGRAESLIIDLLWAIFVTYISALFVIRIEKEIEKNRFHTGTKIAILILLVISAFLFVWFTYSLPWLDLFENPANI